MKTILCPSSPLSLYDSFVTPNLEKNTDGKPVEFSISSTNDVVEISNNVLIQGLGGVGKTTLMKFFFVNSIVTKTHIPVLIELRSINDIDTEYSLEDLIYQELSGKGSTIKEEYLDIALETGCFIFLLDGYDEILDGKNIDFVRKLVKFRDRYPKNKCIITSRPISEFYEFQDFTILKTCPFSLEQAEEYILKVPYEEKTKTAFLGNLKNGLYKNQTSFCSNPLLLSIMLLTYNDYAGIPSKAHMFYSQAFETLFHKHDATKDGVYKREIQSKLNIDSFKKIFASFCFYTYVLHRLEFTHKDLVEIFNKIKKSNKQYLFDVDKYILDLKNAVCVFVQEGDKYIFTHRSFQEYFCALYLEERTDKELTALSLKMISKSAECVYDDVFIMLRDMNEDRFNLSVLIPLIDNALSDYKDDEELYWLTVLFSEIEIDLDGDNPRIGKPLIRNVFRATDTESIPLRFLRLYSWLDFQKNCSKSDRWVRKSMAYIKSFCSSSTMIIRDDASLDFFKNNLDSSHVKFSAQELYENQMLLDKILKVTELEEFYKFSLSYKTWLIENSNNSIGFPDVEDLFN